MPDYQRKTVSATEAPALFNASPYLTRWLLWQRFRGNIATDIEGDDRMSAGLRMQPMILEQAAKDLRLHVVPNTEDKYVSRGPLGCTRDAIILHPEKGPGCLEVKAVFDFNVWMAKWGGGERPSLDYEIQLQVQMFVGDETGSYSWGIIAAWIGGSQYYFEREPIPKLWEELQTEAAKFLSDVELGIEPEPFGAPIEIPWLMKLYPTDEKKVLDLRESPIAAQLSRHGRQYNESARVSRDHKKVAEVLRAEIVSKFRGAGTILLPDGMSIHMGKRNRLKVYVPNEPAVETESENDD